MIRFIRRLIGVILIFFGIYLIVTKELFFGTLAIIIAFLIFPTLSEKENTHNEWNQSNSDSNNSSWNLEPESSSELTRESD